ncbi:MAG: tRNA (adenosine(37)-N6)-threonylcarbamoyltransferase complex dimerization subunit type 1 TsaB [Candidatus Sericytochromatia bacterium]|nr:tRNA (adenosine(37)-N6)-threonylcarbamoyltransferase complex dimerization subunit type 1 TsaB [Candidatus Tanganyikabacteria bacterium]
MWILAINTATDALGVGIVRCEAGRPIESAAEVLLAPPGAGRGGHSERLLPALAWAAESAGLTPADLGGVAVVVGPGGFTGIRTGLAAAKAISQSRGIPIWGVDTLEALAAGYPARGLVSPLLDARRGDVFAALYRRSGPTGLDLVAPPALVPLAAWLEELAGSDVVFLGEGAVRNAATAAGTPPEAHVVRPATVARLAAPHLAEGGEDPMALVPRYHRAPVMAPDWRPGAGMKS